MDFQSIFGVLVRFFETESAKGRGPHPEGDKSGRGPAEPAAEALLDRPSDSRNSLERSSRARARTPASGSAAEAAEPCWALRRLQEGSGGHLVALHFYIVFSMPFLIDFGSVLGAKLAPKIDPNQ